MTGTVSLIVALTVAVIVTVSVVVSVAVFVSAAFGSSHVGDVGFAVDREVEGERDIGRRCLAVNDDLGTSM